jgi:hypothetical protein
MQLCGAEPGGAGQIHGETVAADRGAVTDTAGQALTKFEEAKAGLDLTAPTESAT